MTRRLPTLEWRKGTDLRRAYTWIGHQVEPYPAGISLAAIFSALDFLAIFSAPLGKSSDSEETINATTLGVPCPPHGELLLYKTTRNCFINNSATNSPLPHPLNSHAPSIGVSR